MEPHPSTPDLDPTSNHWSTASKRPLTLDDLPELASRRQVADFLGVSVPTLARWAMLGEGPRVTKIGAHVRYRRAHVRDYIDAAAA